MATLGQARYEAALKRYTHANGEETDEEQTQEEKGKAQRGARRQA